MSEQVSEQIKDQVTVNIDLPTERQRARLLSLLFCDFVNFTKDDKVNLLGIFDRIYVHPEKRMTPNFAMYIRVAEITSGFAITVFAPDDLPAVQFHSKVAEKVFTPNAPRQVQTVIGVQFQVNKEGVYWFDVTHEGSSIGGAGLVIEYRKSEEKESGTDTYV
ncbi:MAG TPA: hypothetical protein VES69_07980 [Pyrinomonadaceae bacterium]|nr:hypothetical protein [Pyrinomonadaceae bacterium]